LSAVTTSLKLSRTICGPERKSHIFILAPIMSQKLPAVEGHSAVSEGASYSAEVTLYFRKAWISLVPYRVMHDMACYAISRLPKKCPRLDYAGRGYLRCVPLKFIFKYRQCISL
jgi:hypothetical protein